METRLIRIEDKIDKLASESADNRVTLVKNTATLEEHVRRTNLLEKQVAPMWLTYKAVGAIVGATFIVAAVVEILEYFKQS